MAIMNLNDMAIEYAKGFQDKSRIYFIERNLSTFNASVGRLSQFILFPRQKVFLRTLAENKAVISLKHRQVGCTTITAAWVTAQMVFADPEAPETCLCIGNKLDLSQQMVTKIRDFLLQVPRWYWGDEYYSPDPKSEKNKREIFVKSSKSEIELFNGCRVVARSSGPNAARGLSAVSILIFDEAAFIENGQEVYSSAVAATASVPNSKVVMVSTPNGKDELYYETYTQALDGKNNYKVVEFKWYQDLRYNKFLSWYKINKETKERKEYKEEVLDKSGTVEYNEQHWADMVQNGWTPTSPWYENMCRQFNNDTMKIAQELDCSFMGSANNVVASEYIEQQRTLNVRDRLADMQDPMVLETWFWKAPIEGHRYIVSADPSRGSSNDFTAIEIIDVDGRDENGMPIIEQVAEFVGKRYGDEVGDLLFKYATLYNNAYVVIDATGGSGDACALRLISLGYKNLYYDDDVQKTYTLQNPSKTQGEPQMDKLPGFHFQGNRFPVLSNLAGMIRNNEIKIRSIRVIHELETWIFKGDTGRMDHQSSSHDDTLTSLAMALFVMKFSFNKLEATKSKDEAILKAYFHSSHKPINAAKREDVRKKYAMPFYGSKIITVERSTPTEYSWLIRKI